jgi:hypothetical protein
MILHHIASGKLTPRHAAACSTVSLLFRVSDEVSLRRPTYGLHNDCRVGRDPPVVNGPGPAR